MSAFRWGTFAHSLIRATRQSGIAQTEVMTVRRMAIKVKSKEVSVTKLGLVGIGLGATAGTGYALYSKRDERTRNHMIHEKAMPRVIDKLPDVKITKKVYNPNDKSGLEIVLFQFQTCPFCCKVREYLDYQGLSYSLVEVDAVLRQDLKWSDYKKVPLLLVRRGDGKYVRLTDSSTIISVIASYLHNPTQDIGDLARLYPSVSFFNDNGTKQIDVMNKYFLMYQDNVPKNLTREQMQEERKWRSWADSHLVHLISPNVYRTREEAFETFDWFSKAGEWGVYFPSWERDMMVYIGATAMWLISKRLKKRHQLTDDVRSHIYDALNKWTNELKNRQTKFMGGSSPSLADLSVYGVLCSMEGCSAFKDCLQNTEIGEWFYAIKDIVNKNKGHIIREQSIQSSALQRNVA